MSIRLTPILLVACALLAGCGGTSGSDRPNQEASLLLDFTPNGVHAGIYLATSRGYDDAEGVQLEVQAPSASTDALRLLQGGRADMAILDIHDLGLARQEGADIVGVMALVQTPLAAVLAQPEIERPRDLEGRRAGVTGLPSDVAVLRSVVAGDGGDPDQVRTTTIGFEAVKALLAGPRRRRDRLLERRGRRAARGAPGHAGVPRRRVRRSRLPGARAVRDPRDARGEARRWSRRRSGRSSAATRRPRPTRRAR